MAEYETYELGALQEGTEVEVELFDRETKERFRARVAVARDPAQLPGAVRLLAWDVGSRTQEWWMVLKCRVGEEEEEQQTVRRTAADLKDRQGFLLRSLLKERANREKAEKGDKGE